MIASATMNTWSTPPMPLLSLPTTPYADWIYTITSTAGLMVIVWLVLRPQQR